MTTLVVIGNGDVFRFSHPFLSLCPLRPRHSGVTGAPTALVLYPPATSLLFFLLFFFFFSSFFSFSPGDVSWRHTTSHGVIGLKYLEPSCSAGGRDRGTLWMRLLVRWASEVVLLAAGSTGIVPIELPSGH